MFFQTWLKRDLFSMSDSLYYGKVGKITWVFKEMEILTLVSAGCNGNTKNINYCTGAINEFSLQPL